LPVDAAGVGEAEEIGVGGVDDELGDEVFVAVFMRGGRFRRGAAGGRWRWGSLEIAGVGDGDGDLLVGDEVFELEVGGFVEDLGAADVAVFVADLGELFDDDFAELLFAGEDGLELGDVVADLGELFEELVDGELGEAIELQFEDRVDLAVGEDEDAGGGEGHVDAVLGGVEGDAGELCTAEVMRLLEKKENRFSRASARDDDWRMMRMTWSR